MNARQKLTNNLLSRRAPQVLGAAGYAIYLQQFLLHLPRIVESRDLKPLDRAMGRRVDTFRYRGQVFSFDCRGADEFDDDSFTFGTIRELCIRDCYFRHHPLAVFENARVVMDLGANRGVFSTMMAGHADFILSVEGQEQFAPIIMHNMHLNGQTSYALEIGIVGTDGTLRGSPTDTMTIPQLCEKHGLERINFLKMDIEGSEFSLFREPDWLSVVDAITLEIHPEFGTAETVLAPLREAGFSIVMADDDLNTVSNQDEASFAYAWRD